MTIILVIKQLQNDKKPVSLNRFISTYSETMPKFN